MRALILALAFSGCGVVKVDGPCNYTRTVETSYTCQPDGKMEHYKIDAPEG